MPYVREYTYGFYYTVTDDYTYKDSLIDRVEELLAKDRDKEAEYELCKTCEFLGELWTSACVIVNEKYADEYFKNYINESISCCLGAGIKELPSFIVIDYESTAKNLTDYYTVVEFEGETYYVGD